MKMVLNFMRNPKLAPILVNVLCAVVAYFINVLLINLVAIDHAHLNFDIICIILHTGIGIMPGLTNKYREGEKILTY